MVAERKDPANQNQSPSQVAEDTASTSGTQSNNCPPNQNSDPVITEQAQPKTYDNEAARLDTPQSPHPSICITVWPQVSMEIAIRELQQTLREAKEYQQTTPQHQQHLQLHISALKEDAEILSAFVLSDEDRIQQVTELICESRRTCRHLERAIIDLDIKENKTPASVTSIATTSKSKVSGLKLTPIQLPIFEGNATTFPIYRSIFEENILNNEDLTETGKWLRLKETLKGQAAELISEIPQSENSLHIAWNLIIQVYGGDERPVVDLFNRLQSLPQSTMDTRQLRLTHSKLEGLLMALEQMHQETSGNHFVRWTYMGKFPAQLLYQVQKSKDTPLTELRLAISEAIAIRECTDQQRAHLNVQINTEKGRTTTQLPLTAGNQEQSKRPSKLPQKPLKCTFCEEQHWNDQCPKYSTVEDRKSRLTGKCLKCLRTAHATPCAGEPRKCFHCDSSSHNRALCPVKFGGGGRSTAQLAILPRTGVADTGKKTGHFLTFTAQASSQYQPQPIMVRILLDTAGGSTLATKNIAEKLKIPTSNKNPHKYTGLGGVTLSYGRELKGAIQLHTNDGTMIPIQAELIEGTIPQVPTSNIQEFRQNNPQYDHIFIPPTGDQMEIDLLIGSDNVMDVLAPEKINAINADTLLLPTKFGSLIVGRQRQHQLQVCQSMLYNFLINPLKQLYDVDLIGLTGIDQPEIDDEQRAIEQFYKTVQFTDNRYSISWPWRTDPPQLDSNYGLALGRLRSLHKRLEKSPQILAEYHIVILKQLQQGIIEHVSKDKPASSIVHYLPHHPIIQPEKEIRPVIDGSSKTTSTSKSLNDNIRKGTQWLNDLTETLIRFRRTTVAVIADIARAFHQISINEEDRDAARFLWLRDPHSPTTPENILIFRFKRVAFGIIASPFVLRAVIQHHANQQAPHRFTDIILADMYADNLVVALEDDINPQEFYTHAKKFFDSMSMNLTKWASNDKELLALIPQNDQMEGVIQSVLGINWNIQRDILTLKKPKTLPADKPTPRTVARETASHFDPLGWAAPVILEAKIFFRQVWEETQNWDQQLGGQKVKEWSRISNNLNSINTICVDRRYSPPSGAGTEQQLHTFVDASKHAYAAVVYLRSALRNSTHISLIIAKTRLTPKKQTTIPKLELAAILLGCKLTNFVKQALKTPDIETYIWSDSKCAVSWMTLNKILPPIIEKHIKEAKKFNITSIKYVPSNMNYADVASRGATVETLQEMDWWSGPNWLQNTDEWPTSSQEIQPVTEIQLVFQNRVTIKSTVTLEEQVEGVATVDIKRFSQLGKLLKRTAYCLKALVKLKKHNFLKLQAPIDTNAALRWWIYWDQSRVYALSEEPEAGKHFMLRNISVFRDEMEIIRCQTRLVNAAIPTQTINPILLVKKSSLTRLIIMEIHDKNLHAGTAHTLAELRKNYWLPQGRREIQNTIFTNCYTCRKQVAKPYPSPQPAPLPEFRVTRSQKPFEAIGLDICGPIYTKEKPGKNQQKIKRWIMIFTCAVIRAIHLEILKNMTTEEILMAFRRFQARRGTPKIIISDNAPQFRKLDDTVKNVWNELPYTGPISTYFATHRILWKFVNEYAPWMGGLYERLIKNVKTAIEKTYGNTNMIDAQFETSIIEIEGVLNTRPIAYVETEPDSPIITPAHFLRSQYSAVPIHTERIKHETQLGKLWRSSQAHLDEFWKNWSNTYLLMLRERNDQLKQQNAAPQAPEKGDIVILLDQTNRRSAWQTAVVERKIPGNDGKVRAVQIRLPHGVRLIKPIIKLAPLQLKMDLPNINDEQLSKDTRNITVALLEDAAQTLENETTDTVHLNANNNENNTTDNDNRGYIATTKGKRGEGETGQCAPSNGLENEGGPAAGEPKSRETSSTSGCPPRSVVDTHELIATIDRERPSRYPAEKEGEENGNPHLKEKRKD